MLLDILLITVGLLVGCCLLNVRDRRGKLWYRVAHSRLHEVRKRKHLGKAWKLYAQNKV